MKDVAHTHSTAVSEAARLRAEARSLRQTALHLEELASRIEAGASLSTTTETAGEEASSCEPPGIPSGVKATVDSRSSPNEEPEEKISECAPGSKAIALLRKQQQRK